MRNKKLNTNEELVIDLMNWSPFGALGQGFIMEAIRYYSEKVATQDAKPNPDAFIDPMVWQAIGKDVHTRCEAFYNRHDVKEEA